MAETPAERKAREKAEAAAKKEKDKADGERKKIANQMLGKINSVKVSAEVMIAKDNFDDMPKLIRMINTRTVMLESAVSPPPCPEGTYWCSCGALACARRPSEARADQHRRWARYGHTRKCRR